MQTKKFSLTVLSSRDYNSLASKYPKRVRNRILTSKGFTDTKRGLAFIKDTNNKTELAGTAIHELLHLAGENISEKEECRLLFKNEKPTDASIQWTQSPEYGAQMDLFNTIQKPYMQEQLKNYQDIYSPDTQQLGAVLARDLANPISDPLWGKVWQQTKERTMAPFDTQSRQMSQRFASTGALNSSGQVNKAFQQLDYNKQKSIEGIAIDQAIAEWQAKQQAISNMNNFIQGQPQFNIPMPSSQSYIQPGKAGSSSAAKAWSMIAPMSGLSDIAGNVQTGGDYGNVNWMGSQSGGSYTNQ